MATTTAKRDAYAVVTDRILEALEQGVVPWRRPWRSLGAPVSLQTGRTYSGVNVLTLTLTSELHGYGSPYWITYKQAKERGGHVRRGEKATPVVFWKWIEKPADTMTDEDGAELTALDGGRRFPILRSYSVFNAEQCEGVETPPVPALVEHDPIEQAERIADGMPRRPELRHGGDSAHYSPALDYVQMPLRGAFDTIDSYYGVLFHELTHATGHPARLNRPTVATATRFGSESYAREELVAEIGAAFLSAEAGIEPRYEQSAAYVAGWLEALRNDRRLVVVAAAQAGKASNYVLGRGNDER